MLVDADGFYGALAGLRGLRRAGFRPWLLTSARGTYADLSRAPEGRVVVPSAQSRPEAFAAAALAEAERLGAESVLPGTEGGLLALAGLVPAAPAREIVERALDKDALTALAERSGLATPPTALVEPGDDAGFAYPLIVKPVRTKTPGASGELHHGRASIVDDRDALAVAARALPGERVLVQPLLGGELGAVSGVAWNGELVTAVHQRSLRISPPRVGVSALAQTVAPDAELESAVGRLVRAFEWSGLFQLQVVWRDGVPYAIDFNPRMYGSLALAISAGANLPAIWADLVAGREPQLGPYRVGAYYRSEEKEAQALVLALRRRDWPEALDVLRPRRGATHAGFATDDPAPVLGALRRLVG